MSTKTVIPGILPELSARTCCLLAEDLDLIHDIPVFGHIWPKIMVDLTGDALRHRSGTTWWGMVLRKERSGIVYTCNAGFVDLGHLRDFADLTRQYFYALIRRKKASVIERGTRIPLLQTHGGIQGEIVIQKDIPYAADDDLDFVIDVARSIAYEVSVIYEIKTFGETRIGGRSSSFSPEDLVSNFLGAYVGGIAVKEELKSVNATVDDDVTATRTTSFDAATTLEIVRLLSELKPLGVKDTVAAFDAINGKWVKKKGLLNFNDPDYVRRRNMKVRPVEPWFVPDLDQCPSPTFPDNIPREWPEEAVTSNITGYHFESDFFENFQFLNTDFEEYMDLIRDAASLMFGPDFDRPD